MGGQSSATGLYSTALGFFASADGDYSIAVGSFSNATGEYVLTPPPSLSLLRPCRSSFYLSFSLVPSFLLRLLFPLLFLFLAYSWFVVVQLQWVTALLLQVIPTITCYYRRYITVFNLGENNLIILLYHSGQHAFAVGTITQASATASVAMGSDTLANATYAVAMGYLTVAMGTSSFAVGDRSLATNNYATGTPLLPFPPTIFLLFSPFPLLSLSSMCHSLRSPFSP